MHLGGGGPGQVESEAEAAAGAGADARRLECAVCHRCMSMALLGVFVWSWSRIISIISLQSEREDKRKMILFISAIC